MSTHSEWKHALSSQQLHIATLEFLGCCEHLTFIILTILSNNRSETNCILKAKVHKTGTLALLKPPPPKKAEYSRCINWIGVLTMRFKSIGKKVIALEFWPTLMFLVPMSVLLFLIFWPTVCVRSSSQGLRQPGLVGRTPSREQRSEDYWSGFLFNHL